MEKLLRLITGLFLGFGLVACGASGANVATNHNETTNTTNEEQELQVVTVGVAGAFQDQWRAVNEILAPEGIYVELVHFTEWTIINTALNDGEIDLNAFQNVLFFDNALNQNGYDLTAIGYTFITPMNLFAGAQADIEANPERHTLVGYIEEGANIGIPSDATNAGRALKVLQAAGLIELDPEVGFFGTESDIIANPFNINIILAEANTLPSLLPDLHAAVLNAAQALTHDLSPTFDSIFREDAFNLEITEALKNIIVASEARANDPIFARIVEAYQTQAVADVFENFFDGAFIPAWD